MLYIQIKLRVSFKKKMEERWRGGFRSIIQINFCYASTSANRKESIISENETPDFDNKKTNNTRLKLT